MKSTRDVYSHFPHTCILTAAVVVICLSRQLQQGAPQKDAMGGVLADRIPCLKVKLLLPNWTPGAGSRNQASPDSGGLKKVIQPFYAGSLNYVVLMLVATVIICYVLSGV